MTITREDLEMAAKAAGLHLAWRGEPLSSHVSGEEEFGDADYLLYWNPGTDDGDCARMCAAVGIGSQWDDDCLWASSETTKRSINIYAAFKDHANDKCAARRHASVKLAAAVGRAMP